MFFTDANRANERWGDNARGRESGWTREREREHVKIGTRSTAYRVTTVEKFININLVCTVLSSVCCLRCLCCQKISHFHFIFFASLFSIKRLYLFWKYNQFYLHGECECRLYSNSCANPHWARWVCECYPIYPFRVTLGYNWVTCHNYLQFLDNIDSTRRKMVAQRSARNTAELSSPLAAPKNI